MTKKDLEKKLEEAQRHIKDLERKLAQSEARMFQQAAQIAVLCKTIKDLT